MSVCEMMLRMPSSEFSEWVAFSNVEPFGEERADLRAGMIASPLLNIQIGKGRKTRPEEWIMNFDPPEPQSPEQMKLLLKGLAAARKARGKKSKR